MATSNYTAVILSSTRTGNEMAFALAAQADEQRIANLLKAVELREFLGSKATRIAANKIISLLGLDGE